MDIKNKLNYSPWSVIWNMLLLYICYEICRIVFVWENWMIFKSNLTPDLYWSIFVGGLRFDTAGIIYTNILYFLLVLLPLHIKETRVMQRITKWVYVVVNAICIIANLADCVYFSFTERRTTVSVFTEFGGNTNIGSVVGVEMLRHWYLVLLAIIMIAFLIKFYRNSLGLEKGEKLKHYYVRQSVIFLIVVPLLLWGMRGHFFSRVSRPISIAEAHQYVKEASQAGIVLNTPFSIIRTSHRTQIHIPQFFEDRAVAEAVFSPLHYPSDSLVARQKNVVILMLEGFSQEFLGIKNKNLDGGAFQGYTEFLDSLYQHSLTFKQSFSNGWSSIDAIPIVQSSLPKIFNPYVLSPYSSDDTPGIAKELKDKGYYSAYFHGAENSSLGLQATAKQTGYVDYFGMDEYVADSRFGGKDDFDGTWAIWDEEFMQFFCLKMSEMPQPFLTTIFTATSHHPFAIPERYKAEYDRPTDTHPIQKCIRYTDNAVREFFNTARQQPWYDNTIFVIIADHCYRQINRDEYRNDLGNFRIPIIFYDPTGEMPQGERDVIAQQIDIMPTILNYLGYDQPYVAYGKDLINTEPQDSWAFMFQDTPQLVKGEYLLQLKDFEPSALYNYITDPGLQNNLLLTGGYNKEVVDSMEMQIKAILQSADQRMKDNDLIYKHQ